MSLRLGFDVDEVLADFRTAFLAVARRQELAPGEADPSTLSRAALSSPEIRKAWKAISATPDWWSTLSCFEPGQIARLHQLARRFGWEVFFITSRPATTGESVQLQTQRWLERHGFALPSVLTVGGSRGDLANALRLDAIVDDQIANCADILAGSPARAMLMLRDSRDETHRYATERGIGVVTTLAEALDVVEHLQEVLPERRGRLRRLSDWFTGARSLDSRL